MIVMIAEAMSLGILSLPSVLAAIGLVPGIIVIAGLGILATYTGYVIGHFKLKYPYVHNVADAGEVMAGPIGREVFGGAQMLFLVFVMDSHVLTFSIMMNTLTNHGTCTIVFSLVGMIVSLICCLPRTLHKVSYMAIASFVSIIAAVLTTTIGVGIESPGNGSVQATIHTGFQPAFLAVTTIIFACSGENALNLRISALKARHYLHEL